jgi:hypothetical protein
VATFGRYAVFAAKAGIGFGFIYAYDVQRNLFFTAVEGVAGSIGAFGGTNANSLAVVPAMTAASPTGVNAQWTIVVPILSGATTLATLWSIGMPSGGTQVIPAGRILSSAIDFTSASLKLFRQIVVSHAPNLTSGVSLTAWLDQDVDSLNAVADFQVTNSTTNSTTTILPINKIARKLVYLFDYPNANPPTVNASRPKSIAIQAATGWTWKMELACSNGARMNTQAPNSFCYGQQGFDAKVAYNFIRQLWRQKGGQCLATFPDGDQYNAVIESVDFVSPKPNAVTMSGDRKTHYEVTARLTIREDI